MSSKDGGGNEVLTPSEVAAMLHVDAKTVARYTLAGILPCFRTFGGKYGHRRFYRRDVEALIAERRRGDER